MKNSFSVYSILLVVLLATLSVSCKKTAATGILSVTTSPVTIISVSSAKTGGDVVINGGDPVTAQGVCWGTTPSPTISNSKTTNGTGGGSFISYLTNLTGGTTYYVRAYATNVLGTVYGNEETFKQPIP